MRNFKIIFALVFGIGLMLTSCQKEVIEDASLAQESTHLNHENIPVQTAKKVEGEVLTFTEEITKKMSQDKPEIIIDQQLINNQIAQSRNGDEDSIKIELACVPQKVELRCGSSFISSNDHDCNSVTDGLYSSRGFRSNLNGGDNIYFFDATSDMEVTFTANTLRGNRGNLAMFLFEGDYDISRHRAIIRKVIASSTSSSIFSEELNKVSLKRNKRYILIVDSAPNKGADYRMIVTCATPNRCEDFESYRTGDISPQNPSVWEKWDFNSQDGRVNNNGFQYLAIARDPFTGAQFQQDVIFKTGRISRGVKTLSMDMWIFDGHSGYFNIQKRLRQEFGAQIYFHNRGSGEIKIANRVINFSYPQDAWMDIELVFNFNTGRVSFRINGRSVASWATKDSATTTNGSSQLEGIDFFAAKSDTEYFIDNICLK